MKRKTILLTVLAAIFGVLIFSLPVLAAGSGQCSGGGGCGGGGCMIDQIPNITDTQKAQFMKLHLEFRKKMITMKAELAKQELDMKALLMEDAGDKVNAKIDEIYKLKAQLQKECYAHCKAMFNLLNDEQKKSIGSKSCLMIGCCGGGGEKGCCGGHSHCCGKHLGQGGCCGQAMKCGQGQGQQKTGCEAMMKAGKCPGHGETK